MADNALELLARIRVATSLRYSIHNMTIPHAGRGEEEERREASLQAVRGRQEEHPVPHARRGVQDTLGLMLVGVALGHRDNQR